MKLDNENGIRVVTAIDSYKEVTIIQNEQLLVKLHTLVRFCKRSKIKTDIMKSLAKYELVDNKWITGDPLVYIVKIQDQDGGVYYGLNKFKG